MSTARPATNTSRTAISPAAKTLLGKTFRRLGRERRRRGAARCSRAIRRPRAISRPSSRATSSPTNRRRKPSRASNASSGHRRRSARAQPRHRRRAAGLAADARQDAHADRIRRRGGAPVRRRAGHARRSAIPRPCRVAAHHGPNSLHRAVAERLARRRLCLGWTCRGHGARAVGERARDAHSEQARTPSRSATRRSGRCSRRRRATRCRSRRRPDSRPRAASRLTGVSKTMTPRPANPHPIGRRRRGAHCGRAALLLRGDLRRPALHRHRPARRASTASPPCRRTAIRTMCAPAAQLALPKDGIINLDGAYGLNAKLPTFKALWDQKQLAIVHAVVLALSRPLAFRRPERHRDRRRASQCDRRRLAQPRARAHRHRRSKTRARDRAGRAA